MRIRLYRHGEVCVDTDFRTEKMPENKDDMMRLIGSLTVTMTEVSIFASRIMDMRERIAQAMMLAYEQAQAEGGGKVEH